MKEKKTLIMITFLLILLISLKEISAGEIHDAVAKGSYTKVKKILESNKELVNQRDEEGKTPLIIAAHKGQSKMMKFLISKGASIKTADNLGNSSLYYAIMNEEEDLQRQKIILLISKGADTKLKNK